MYRMFPNLAIVIAGLTSDATGRHRAAEKSDAWATRQKITRNLSIFGLVIRLTGKEQVQELSHPEQTLNPTS